MKEDNTTVDTKKSNGFSFFWIVFTVTMLIVFGIVMFHELKHGDFPPHIEWARQYSEDGYLYKIPHTLFAKIVTVVRALLPANIAVWVSVYAKQVYDIKSFEISSLIVMVLSYIGSAYIIVRRMIEEWKIKKPSILFFAGFATLVIILAAPIFLFTFPDRMFLGYVMGNRYDSPTYILAKPFVLMLFIGLVDNLYRKWNWKQAILTVIAMMCATLAKPSFTITILPALAIVMLFRINDFKKFNWLYLIFPVGITAAAVLASQFIINYVGDRGDRIIFAPFESILIQVPNMFMVVLLILMSILFPLLVTIIDWKKIKNDLSFQLVWINFIVAILYGLLFAEEINLGLNNFWNSPMIAVFVLFFATVMYWGKNLVITIQQKEKITGKQVVVTSALTLHLICGIIYYIAQLLNTGINVN